MTEYEQWKRKNSTGRGWKIKYYKGLGTSSPQEAKDYFGALDRHRITFRWGGDADGQLLDMVFNRKRATEKKEWLARFEVRGPNPPPDHLQSYSPLARSLRSCWRAARRPSGLQRK